MALDKACRVMTRILPYDDSSGYRLEIEAVLSADGELELQLRQHDNFVSFDAGDWDKVKAAIDHAIATAGDAPIT